MRDSIAEKDMTKYTALFSVIALLLGIALGRAIFGGKSGELAKTPPPSPAQTKREAEPATKDRPPRVDHILLEVADMQASLAFYRDQMGLRPKSLNAGFSTLEGADVDVYLSSSRWDWEAPRGKDERQGLGMYPHFEMPSVTEAVDRLRKAGFKIVQEPRKYDWGTEAFVADPDGYTWALVSSSN
jgi:catechol 2,3-dioxygenase-like lactoylglutathione lyase family enzyme